MGQLRRQIIGLFDVPHPELIKIGFPSKKTLSIPEL